MSTLQGNFEQDSSVNLDPPLGAHRPSHADSRMPHNDVSGEEERVWKEDLCHAICVNNWNDVKVIIDQNHNALTAKITSEGQTALHVAAMFGHVSIVEELLKSIPPGSLTTCDSDGETALLLASIHSGNVQVAKCLVNKNNNSSDILGTPSTSSSIFIPVTAAFANGHEEMGRYLYSVTPLKYLTGCCGSYFVYVCIHTHCLDIALNLLQQCPELLSVPIDDSFWTPIHEIATLNTTIPSSSDLTFWKRWIYNYISTHSTTTINQVCVDIQQETSRGDQGVKKIQELKVLHAQADDLLHLVCKNARKAYQEGVIDEALRTAAKKGNVEFVFQVSQAVPEIFLHQTFISCFVEALDYRQVKVFNLIHRLHFKNTMVTAIDEEGNTLLHRAAIKAPDHVLNRIYAPTLQMQRELQWFKEVESLTPPCYRTHHNNDDMTPEEIFRESHGDLMEKGEKWIKATASSCSVVGTLIVTIMFAAAFTVPGGNDQILGYPLFIKQPFFNIFIFSTILSLLSSSTAVLMFLAILTSQYSEEKFLKSLPSKLILGLFSLFISNVSMVISFLSTIRLMLNHTNYSWGILPVIILASFPIFLFVLSQYSLLVHTYTSTYGNIFDTKVKPWPEVDL